VIAHEDVNALVRGGDPHLERSAAVAVGVENDVVAGFAGHHLQIVEQLGVEFEQRSETLEPGADPRHALRSASEFEVEDGGLGDNHLVRAFPGIWPAKLWKAGLRRGLARPPRGYIRAIDRRVVRRSRT
jgi:hypothetical protein